MMGVVMEFYGRPQGGELMSSHKFVQKTTQQETYLSAIFGHSQTPGDSQSTHLVCRATGPLTRTKKTSLMYLLVMDELYLYKDAMVAHP